MEKYPCPQFEPCPHMLPDGSCGLADPANECDDYAYEYGFDELIPDEGQDISPCDYCKYSEGCPLQREICRVLDEYLKRKGQ